jgi:hypothetical protein
VSTLQVDALIEAFYHLDENVKGEFLGMQMNKVIIARIFLSCIHFGA